MIGGQLFSADITTVGSQVTDPEIPLQLIEIEYEPNEDELAQRLATTAFDESRSAGAPVLACPAEATLAAQCLPIKSDTDVKGILEKNRASDRQRSPNNKLRLGIGRLLMNGGITATIFFMKGVPAITSLTMGLGVGLWSFTHQMIAPSYVQWLYSKSWVPQLRLARPQTSQDRDALREAHKTGGIKRRMFILTHVHVPPPTEEQKAGRWTPILKNFTVALVFNTALRTAVYHFGIDPQMFNGIENTAWTVLNTVVLSPASAVWMEYFPQRISAMVAAAILKEHPERAASVRAWQNRVAFGQSGTVVATTVADNVLGKAWGSVAKFLVGLGGAVIYNKEAIKNWYGEHVPQPVRKGVEYMGTSSAATCSAIFQGISKARAAVTARIF